MSVQMLLAIAAQAASSPAIEGLWRSPGGNSVIAIASCGAAWCGTVAWASEQAKKDAGKATAQLVGTQLLTGLKQDKNGRWIGRLFIPDKNMRVTAKIEPISDSQLKVSGCAMGRAMCKSQLWTKAAEIPERN